MKAIFKHNFSFVMRNGVCSPMVKGIMRKDETAAILPPSNEFMLLDVWKLRYHVSSLEIREYTVAGYHRDGQRPVSEWLIKPIVVNLHKKSYIKS